MQGLQLGNVPTHSIPNAFMGNDGMLGDVGAQNNGDVDLGQHIGQFEATPFDKSADSNRQNFGLYEAADHAMYDDELRASGIDD